MTPATNPLTAWRNARFAEEWYFADDDGLPPPLTGYTGALQVRQYGAQSGDPVISLTNQTTDVEGVRILEPTGGVVRIVIDQETLEAAYDDLFGENEAGTAIVLAYDLVLTAPDGGKDVWSQGSFTINPGVTI